MKKNEVPQDLSALGRITKEVCYATDELGNYTKELSKGWDVKIDALDAAWNDIETRKEAALKKIQHGEASPLLFFMEGALMDINLLAGYTGFWKWQIRRHMQPKIFAGLSEKKLQRYADVFNITTAELKSMKLNEDRV